MAHYLAIFTALVGFGLGVRGLKRPGILLGLIWSLFAFEQVAQTAIPQLLARSWLTNVIMVGLATLAVINRYLSSDNFRQLKLTQTHLFAALLLGMAFASILWTISPSDTSTYLKKSSPYLLAFVVIAPLCLFNEKQLDYAVSTVVYFGALILLAAALGNFGARGLQMGHDGRASEANPLAIASFGGYVVICTIFRLYLKKYNDTYKNVFHLAIIGLGLYVIVRSGSRGQLLAAVAACGIWVPITAQLATRKSTIIAIVMALAVGFLSVYMVRKVNSVRWQTNFVEEATEGRFDQTFHLLDTWFNEGSIYVLLGLGNSASYLVIGGYPHNVPGEVLAEEGLLGFILLIGFLASVTLTGALWLKNRSLDRNSEFGIKVGMLLTLFTFDFILTLKQGSLIGSPSFFCIGLCLANFIRIQRDRQRIEKHQLHAHMSRYQSSLGGQFLFDQNRP